MTGPSRTWRRSGSSGTVASSRAGSVVRSSVGVGACRTSGRSGPASTPSPGSAQVARQTVRARSSTARPASSADGTSPSARTTCHRRAPTRTVSPSSVRRTIPSGRSTAASAGRASRRSGACAAATATRSSASRPARSGSRTSVSAPGGSSASPGPVGHTSRRAGAAPSASRQLVGEARGARCRRRRAPCGRGRRRTPPVLVTTRGASLIAVTAAKPTPKRPTPPDPRLADARSEARPATPSASSGAPAFATCRTLSTARTRRVVVIPARSAASAAFCASSTNHRSR